LSWDRFSAWPPPHNPSIAPAGRRGWRKGFLPPRVEPTRRNASVTSAVGPWKGGQTKSALARFPAEACATNPCALAGALPYRPARRARSWPPPRANLHQRIRLFPGPVWSARLAAELRGLGDEAERPMAGDPPPCDPPFAPEDGPPPADPLQARYPQPQC